MDNKDTFIQLLQKEIGYLHERLQKYAKMYEKTVEVIDVEEHCTSEGKEGYMITYKQFVDKDMDKVAKEYAKLTKILTKIQNENPQVPNGAER